MEDNDTRRSSQAETTSELTDNFAETVRILFSAGNVAETLKQVIALSVDTIDGCDFAGLFLLEGQVVATPMRSDSIVDRVDALQNDSGEGPCLDAISLRSIFYADDLLSEVRWPSFSPAALEIGIRSVLALPVSTSDSLGALNLYARSPSAFGVVDRGKAVILATLAGLALTVAHSHEQDGMDAEDYRAALRTRKLIGQAEGILMEREKISSDHAFDILRQASQHLNIKLREVAQNLVDTGERPDTGVLKPPTRGSDDSSPT